MKLDNVKYEYEIGKNGELITWTIYPEREVTIQVEGKDITVGVQPSYKISNVVAKENAGILYRFLDEQIQLQTDKAKPAYDFVEQHGHLDPYGKVQELLKQIADKDVAKKFKDWNKLDKYADMVAKLQEAKNNIEMVEHSMAAIKSHKTFVEKYL